MNRKYKTLNLKNEYKIIIKVPKTFCEIRQFTSLSMVQTK